MIQAFMISRPLCVYTAHVGYIYRCPGTTVNAKTLHTFAAFSSSCSSSQSAQLQANMARLKDEWAEFLKEQQRLKEEVDEEHAKAVGQVSTQYSEMKKDLTKQSPL